MKFRFGLIALFSAALLISACGDKSDSSSSQENVPTAGKSEGAVISKFYEAIAAGKSDDAIKAIALSGVPEAQSSEFKNKTEKLIAQEKAKIEAKGGIKSVEANKAGDAAVNKDQTPFSVKVTFGDGSTQEGTVNLVKDGNDWKISL